MTRSRFKVPYRRRRQGKTDYYLRRKLIISGKKRLVIRRSSKNIQLQIIKAEKDGDKTLVVAYSNELEKFGWELPCSNLPASYLTGLLLAKRTKEKGLSDEDFILDIGPTVMQYATRTYAALKGVIDGELNIPASDVVFPSEDRISGKHIDTYMEKIQEGEEEAASHQFSNVLAKGDPGIYQNTFEKCKGKLM